MEPLLAIVVGALFAGATFMMMSNNFIRLVLGISMLTNAANLMIFILGRMTRGVPPILFQGAGTLPTPIANPLPQALILTAIVIGFGLLAFTVVLTYRTHVDFKTLHPSHIETNVTEERRE